MSNKFFIIHTGPDQVIGALTMAFRIAQAAGVIYNPGSWLRPASIEFPDSKVEADIIREWLVADQIKFHEAAADLAVA